MFNNTKTCRACGHTFKSGTGKTIKYQTGTGTIRLEDYCKEHAPPYDRHMYYDGYYREVRVNVLGVPVTELQARETLLLTEQALTAAYSVRDEARRQTLEILKSLLEETKAGTKAQREAAEKRFKRIDNLVKTGLVDYTERLYD